MRLCLFIGESRLRAPETGTAGAAMETPLKRALDGLCSNSSADNDKLRLSKELASRLIGDRPVGEEAIAEAWTAGLGKGQYG